MSRTQFPAPSAGSCTSGSAIRSGLAGVLLLAGASAAQATLIHDEAIGGDLIGDPAHPKILSVTAGDNIVRGKSGRLSTTEPVDRDFFQITVQPNQLLSGIDLLDGTTTTGARGVGFIGVVAGTDFGATVPTTAASLLGYHHYSTSDVGTDILPKIGSGAGAIGFKAPLGPGTYALWVQETGTNIVSYGLNLRISTVPDSGPGLLGTLGVLGFTGVAALRSRVGRSKASQ